MAEFPRGTETFGGHAWRPPVVEVPKKEEVKPVPAEDPPAPEPVHEEHTKKPQPRLRKEHAR